MRAFRASAARRSSSRAARARSSSTSRGREYIDFCQSFGPLILGHRDDDVLAPRTPRSTTAGRSAPASRYSLALAEWIVAHVPHVERIRFVSSGTEAVMTALRIARAATGRSRVLKFEGCYHGHVDSMLVKAGSGLAGRTAASSAGISDAVAQRDARRAAR